MSKSILYIQKGHLLDIIITRKLKITPIEGINNIPFSRLLLIEDSFKKIIINLDKFLKTVCNKYKNLVTTNDLLKEFPVTCDFKYEDVEAVLQDCNKKFTSLYAVFDEKTKDYEMNKAISIKEDYKYLDVFYIYVPIKEINKFMEWITNYLNKDLVINTKLVVNENNIFKTYILKSASKNIYKIIKDKYEIDTVVKIKNIKKKEEYLIFLKDTIKIAYQMYIKTIFYKGLIDALQQYGCPLEYFISILYKKESISLLEKLNKDTIVTSEYLNLHEFY